MRHACIDIGSNTTRLLVADLDAGVLRAIREQRAFIGLGEGLRRSGTIAPAKLTELAGVVSAQVRAARELGVAEPRVVATAAIRQAGNREELVAALGLAAGVEVAVLSEDEEARLAFWGATRTFGSLEGVDGEIAVVDVGGGSSELALGTVGAGVRWSHSFAVGSGTLAQDHLRADPPLAGELDAVRRAVTAALQGLPPQPPPALAIAVGGSATSLHRLVGATLDRKSLEAGVELLTSMPISVAAVRLGLEAERVRLLPAGMLLLAEISTRLGSPLRIGRGGLREGMILDLAGPGSGGA